MRVLPYMDAGEVHCCRSGFVEVNGNACRGDYQSPVFGSHRNHLAKSRYIKRSSERKKTTVHSHLSCVRWSHLDGINHTPIFLSIFSFQRFWIAGCGFAIRNDYLPQKSSGLTFHLESQFVSQYVCGFAAGIFSGSKSYGKVFEQEPEQYIGLFLLYSRVICMRSGMSGSFPFFDPGRVVISFFQPDRSDFRPSASILNRTASE